MCKKGLETKRKIPSIRGGIANACGFTLVELLIVIGIIAVLISILLPALNHARASANQVACMSNLRQLGIGLVLYNTENHEYNIPSYTMTGYASGPTNFLEGWASILDRDNLIKGKDSLAANVYCCPVTVDMKLAGQTGTDPSKPQGWMEWPNTGLGTPGVTIPSRGFNRILRVGYWINADNPIASSPVASVTPDLYYTSSVGYGPATDGSYLRLTRATKIRRATQTIVLADGIYAGRQKDIRYGVANSRVGYRHKYGGKPAANVVYADGHADSIAGNVFPRAKGAAGATDDEIRGENLGTNPTCYADPEKALAP